MVAAGFSGYSLFGFMAATVLSRSIRYFGLGFLVWRYGDKAKAVYESNKKSVLAAATGVVLLFWVLFWLVL